MFFPWRLSLMSGRWDNDEEKNLLEYDIHERQIGYEN